MMAHLSISFYQNITILSQLNLCKSKEYGKKIENDLEYLEIPCESHKERYSINRNYVGLIKIFYLLDGRLEAPQLTGDQQHFLIVPGLL